MRVSESTLHIPIMCSEQIVNMMGACRLCDDIYIHMSVT